MDSKKPACTSRIGRRSIARFKQALPSEQCRRPGIPITSQSQGQSLISPTKKPPAGTQQEHPAARTKSCPPQNFKEVLYTEMRDTAGKLLDGKEGSEIPLMENYFHVEKAPDWCLYQYHVDFSPDEDKKQVRKEMMLQNKGALGSYLFDGNVLFTPRKHDVNTFVCYANNGNHETMIRLRLVGRLISTDCHCIQLYNKLMRVCLESLGLQLVGRYYYEADAKIQITSHSLELWPGFITSICQHEQDLLLCTEVTHKVMRIETVYDMFASLSKRIPKNELQAAFAKNIVGAVVITDYNNKTYRIDDIHFKSTLESCFLYDGKYISYREYYKLVVDHLNSWNMKLQKLVILTGRVLPSEKIILKGGRFCEPGQCNDWTRDIRDKPMLRAAEVPSWEVILPSADRRDAQKFVKYLREAALSMDMNLPMPLYKQMEDDNLRSYIETIDSSVTEDNPSILLVIIPNNSTSRYGAQLEYRLQFSMHTN